MNKLEVRQLNKVYDGISALKDVSFEVRDGEFLSILGPSGCGKTTLLRIVIGLLSPTSGTVLKDGEDITAFSSANRGMGIVFQNYALFENMTVLQNVEYALKIKARSKDERAEIRRRALEMIEKVGLSEHTHKRPAELSGGQQQRVAIARALINRPQILFADEPTGNLDKANAEDVLQLLLDTRAELGCALVMVTHDLSIAARADRVFKMEAGRLRLWNNRLDGILPGYEGGEE